jgi:hypothetical protein
MRTLKISFPYNFPNGTFSQFTGENSDIYRGWKILLNQDVPKADAWFVVEDFGDHEKTCEIPEGKLFFGTAETVWPIGFYSDFKWRGEFLKQFDEVYTCHDYYGVNSFSSIPFLPWMINANHGSSILAKNDKDVNFFRSLKNVEKTKLISVICSTQDMTPSHRMRIRFAQELEKHLGSKIIWYGNGINQADTKWEAIADYKYTVVLENQSRHNVITEKIMDAYLGLSYPIYWGAPNITDYFDERSLTRINIENSKKSISTIEKILGSLDYESVLPHILKSKDSVIGELNFINRIIDIVERSGSNEIVSKRLVELKKPIDFQPTLDRWAENLKSQISRKFLKFSLRNS